MAERGRSPGAPGPAGFVLGLDVGSTVIRGHVYDQRTTIRGSSRQKLPVDPSPISYLGNLEFLPTSDLTGHTSPHRQSPPEFTSPQKVEILYPHSGWVEIDPEVLWTQFIAVIKEAVQAAGIQMNQIVGLGISTQRATFITWNKTTGNPFHNFISWQDLRASELVKSWNNSFLMKAIHSFSKVLHFFIRSKRLLGASLLTFTTQHVSLRLAWVLQNLVEVQRAVEEENCCFGTVDTWLLYKLTKGSEYATDFSNASSTGVFDPYQMCWSGFLTFLLSIPLSLLPPVKDTSHNFGCVDEQILGVPIPIVALVADQQSAMFGECCFHRGDVKLTMGTGTFMDINTGNHPQQTVGDLFTDAAETDKMAKSLCSSAGVYFVPSFSGLQAPLNDPHACASFMGLKPSTNKYHLVRAILEAIAFRNKQLYEMMQKEIHIPVTKIRADGGVCNNSFVMQMTSDLINEKIDRPVQVDMSCLGAAFLAGLAVGFWSDKEELKNLRKSEVIFEPQKQWKEYEPNMQNWVKAVQRSMNWYSKM
ncbi:putative glycerol kinase 5 isoform X2 [Tachyglossus aculeatus]|uniref:putative glycerol kinase 5 isoform X2 n=1 Tax=Tachyglossus aculeatus TaxID=9261 RepID=UPI0018F48AAA|nr:putative glycerol kinase 5 isoform X2 [Tachyglossus aculeatus]